MFYLTVPSQTEITLASWPPVVRHVLGRDWQEKGDLEVWNVATEKWDYQLPSLPVSISTFHTAILVRPPDNGLIRGAGRAISILQNESFDQWVKCKVEEYVDTEADVVRVI